MGHVIRDKQKLLKRVRRIQGQLGALERALEQERDCFSVLQQIAACRGAIHGLMAEVLEGHVTCHLLPAEGARREQAAQELLQVLRTYLR